jgi:hypothetical protein
LSTHPTSGEQDQEQAEKPSDGPAREPGSGGDAGSTSQDQPEPNDGTHASSGPGERSATPDIDPEQPADSNERADDRVHVVQPSELKNKS